MVLNPIFQMIIIGTVLQFYLKVNIQEYFQYLFVGLLAWNFFSLSLGKTAPAFVNERNLLQKANFPRESLVVSIVLSNFVHFCIGFLLVIPFLHIFQIHFWLFAGMLVWLLAITLGLSLLFASLNVRFRDVNFFVQAIVPIWFYATPIIYSLELVPEKIQPLIFLNPLTVIFEYLHVALLGASTAVSLIQLAESLIISSAVITVGILVFSRENRNFADWL